MLGDRRRSFIKGLVFGCLFILFIFSFFKYKQIINERNSNNLHLIATLKHPEAPLDKLDTVQFEETKIQEPLTKEAFIQAGQRILANSQKPQKVILINKKNFQDRKATPVSTLTEVAMVGYYARSKLLITRHYPQQESLGEQEAPFVILSTGELGLISNTLKYSVRVTNATDPEQWVVYLPRFASAVQQASELTEAKSLIFIHSKADHFIYDSKKNNQLIELIDLEME